MPNRTVTVFKQPLKLGVIQPIVVTVQLLLRPGSPSFHANAFQYNVSSATASAKKASASLWCAKLETSSQS